MVNLMNFKLLFTQKSERATKILQSYLPAAQGKQKVIFEAMQYSILSGGKRIRPILLAETYALWKEEENSLLHAFMAAIEYVHTYSLVHDDLPALDNDDYRRGKKTTHLVYGEAMGILTGDALLGYAYEIAATQISAISSAKEQQLGIKALQILAKQSGIYGMLGGQVVDVLASGSELDAETLEWMYRKKTGALILAAMKIGAILGGATKQELQEIEQIAGEIGLAFQIQDDLLEQLGDDQTIGKSTQSDQRNQKMTYVFQYGVEKSKQTVEQLSESAQKRLQKLGRRNLFLEQFITYLMTRTD